MHAGPDDACCIDGGMQWMPWGALLHGACSVRPALLPWSVILHGPCSVRPVGWFLHGEVPAGAWGAMQPCGHKTYIRYSMCGESLESCVLHVTSVQDLRPTHLCMSWARLTPERMTIYF